MKHVVLLLIGLIWMPSGAQAGELYRWMDAQGKVHYGDALHWMLRTSSP